MRLAQVGSPGCPRTVGAQAQPLRLCVAVGALLGACTSTATDLDAESVSSTLSPQSRTPSGAGAAASSAQGQATNGASAAPDTPVPLSFTTIGRVATSGLAEGALARFAWPGVAVGFHFVGTGLGVVLSAQVAGSLGIQGPHYFDVVVDGTRRPDPCPFASSTPSPVLLADGLPHGEHTIWLVKRTEGALGSIILHDATLAGDGSWLPPPPPKARRIEVIGASAECGFGVEGAVNCRGYRSIEENQGKAWGQLAADALGADLHNISTMGKGITINYSPAVDPVLTIPKTYVLANGNVDDQPWDFSQWTADAVVVNGGPNDYAGNNQQPPNASRFHDTFVGLVDTIVGNYPKAHVYIMLNPAVGVWRDSLRGLLQAVVDAENGKGNSRVHMLEIPQYTGNQKACDDHPSPALHQQTADQVAATIKRDLGW